MPARSRKPHTHGRLQHHIRRRLNHPPLSNPPTSPSRPKSQTPTGLSLQRRRRRRRHHHPPSTSHPKRIRIPTITLQVGFHRDIMRMCRGKHAILLRPTKRSPTTTRRSNCGNSKRRAQRGFLSTESTIVFTTSESITVFKAVYEDVGTGLGGTK